MEEETCKLVDVFEFNFTAFEFPQSKDTFRPMSWEAYVKIGFYAVAILCALLGNTGVILTVALNRSMRTTINFYVVNLAVADMMICVCCMWVHLINNLTHPLYILGPFMCKFNAFAQMTCLTSSVLTLSAISCDRFIAIMFPLHVRITKQRTSAVITIIWIASLVVSIPLLIYRKYNEIQWSDYLESHCGETWPAVQEFDPVDKKCVTKYPSQQLYYTFVTVTLFFLPVAVMVTAYSLIIWRLWVTELPGERNLANLNVQHRAKKKVIKMVCVVLVAFVLCWMPFQVIILYSQFGHSSQFNGQLPQWFPKVSYFATYVAYANSSLNPIIYGGFNKNFRQGFCNILKCRCSRRDLRRPRSQMSRNTYTTGVTSSPSHSRSKILNGGRSFEMRLLPSSNGIKNSLGNLSDGAQTTTTILN